VSVNLVLMVEKRPVMLGGIQMMRSQHLARLHPRDQQGKPPFSIPPPSRRHHAWAIAFLPGGDALVTERDSARLLRVTPHGRVSTIGTVPGVEPSGEGGLLGVAVSPLFGQDRLVYLYVSTAADNRIVRFRYSGSGIGPLEAVVTGIPRASVHNGGRLAFGPDGMLWASTGEHAEPGIAQDKGSLGGKILRMTPDGRPAPGNPFGTLVWTYGHRNVQGMAWDGDGRMYASGAGT
jgi:glucose/arabinose dehydrogenase